jgi:hypothetical protein
MPASARAPGIDPKNSKIANEVLKSLREGFLKTASDQVFVSISLSSKGMVPEAAGVEGVLLSKDAISSLGHILIVGFAQANFAVRRRLFEVLPLLSLLNCSQFWLQEFLTNWGCSQGKPG